MHICIPFFVPAALYCLCNHFNIYVTTSSLLGSFYSATFVQPYKNSTIMNSNYAQKKETVSFDSLPSLVLRLSNDVQEIQKNIEEIKLNFSIKEPEEYLTRQEIAKKFKVDLSTIHNWVKRGLLKPHCIGNRVYFKKSEIELK